ncbi:CRAL-TRIO domain containing protein, partial [Oryctes borbonicus]
EGFEMVSLIRAALIAYDFRIHQDATVAGETIVLDMNNLKPKHYAKIFGMPFIKFIRFSWNNCPYSLKNVFIVNCHPLLEKGVNLCKSTLPEKIGNRIALLSNPQDLHKYLPRQCLPIDYGGSQGSIQELNSAFTKFLLQRKEFLETISKSKPTGPLPEEVKRYTDEFGLDGSFRKLNID